jgi:CarD family transcriptional regulator
MATAKMRSILSVEEIHALIKAMPNENSIWIEDEFLRKTRYQEILADGNREELIKLVKTLYKQRQWQKNRGKRLHLIDEYFMKNAEKMLHEEFAHVLNISLDQVLPFILEQIQIEDKSNAAPLESSETR